MYMTYNMVRYDSTALDNFRVHLNAFLVRDLVNHHNSPISIIPKLLFPIHKTHSTTSYLSVHSPEYKCTRAERVSNATLSPIFHIVRRQSWNNQDPKAKNNRKHWSLINQQFGKTNQKNAFTFLWIMFFWN